MGNSGKALAATSLLLLGGIGHAQAPNCAFCNDGRTEIARLLSEEQSYSKLLADNQAMLKSIGPDDVSKKIKLTSNLLILSSKVETSQNNRTVKQMELDKKGCASCPAK